MNEIVGEAAQWFIRDKGFPSSAIGDWTADVMRARMKTDVALTNKTGLRANIAKGPIRLRDLYVVSPFGNDLVTLTLKGSELRAELEYSLSDTRFALEGSGLTLRYDGERPVGERIIRLEIGGEPLDPERLYTVTTNSFLAKGGDGHRWLAARRDRVRHKIQLLDLQVEDVRRRKVLAPDPEARIAPAGTTMPVAKELPR
ncbi:5'-nucleotidase C-terminal domain-containing protein [Planctomycetota bacterium]